MPTRTLSAQRTEPPLGHDIGAGTPPPGNRAVAKKAQDGPLGGSCAANLATRSPSSRPTGHAPARPAVVALEIEPRPTAVALPKKLIADKSGRLTVSAGRFLARRENTLRCPQPVTQPSLLHRRQYYLLASHYFVPIIAQGHSNSFQWPPQTTSYETQPKPIELHCRHSL